MYTHQHLHNHLQNVNEGSINFSSVLQFLASLATIAALGIALYSIYQAKKLTLFNFKLRQFEIRPEIRVTEASILQKRDLERAVGDNRIMSGFNMYYYKIAFKNTGNNEAIIQNATVILENDVKEEIITQPTNLAPGEEYIVPIYTVKTVTREAGEGVSSIQKVFVIYTDLFENTIICEAKVSIRLAEPTPYLGVQTNIVNSYKYPEEFIPKTV